MILVEPHVARGATVGLDAHAHRQTSGRPRKPNGYCYSADSLRLSVSGVPAGDRHPGLA